MPKIIASTRCAQTSRERNEMTAGTLGNFDIGVFVEGFAPFPRSALQSIAPKFHTFNMETWWNFYETGNGLHPRILPIRKERKQRNKSFSVFFCLPVPDSNMPLQLHYELADYDELTQFDLVAMRDQPLSFAENEDAGFRVIVCTHGKVDPCCAVDGNAVYRQLRNRSDVETWHGAHFGGCRFAANVWCLPSGNCYGHVSPQSIDSLVDDELQGRVFHTGFRGRIGQSSFEAAAEAHARSYYDVWENEGLVLNVQEMTHPHKVS